MNVINDIINDKKGSQFCERQKSSLAHKIEGLRSVHTWRLLARFFWQNGLQPILSVFQPVTINTKLNKNGQFQNNNKTS